jgi:predicted membrane chloride channel (bestrophin family)
MQSDGNESSPLILPSKDLYHCIAVFIMTYGFAGLGMVAIEMDEPFGTDDNDFDND